MWMRTSSSNFMYSRRHENLLIQPQCALSFSSSLMYSRRLENLPIQPHVYQEV